MAEQYAKAIELPREEIFRNLRNAKRFAIDIGGSLAKLVYLSEVPHRHARCYSQSSSGGPTLSFSSPDTSSENEDHTLPSFPPTVPILYTVEEEFDHRARLHFIKFETKYIEDCLDFIQQNLLESGSGLADKVIRVTGGGAYKYKQLLTSKLNVGVDKYDEMECLINGCNFLLKNIPNEAFQFLKGPNDEPEYIFQDLSGKDIFPYLLVNIGSGVSIIKVEGPDQYERIGGTSTGGGTFWGLGSLLTNAKGFDELLALASQGQHRNVDMLVKDIYGGDYSMLNLPGDLTASSFGKATRSARSGDDCDNGRFKSADIAKALLQMVSNDIGQISSLYAQLHDLRRIVFGGFFIRGNPVTMHTISFAINYFSKGKTKALFLRHEGYLGAIGVFTHGADDNTMESNTSWDENYAGSSEFAFRQHGNSFSSYDKFELDHIRHQYAVCPLLCDADKYVPDLVDLGKDEAARYYWLDCFKQGIHKSVELAIQSQSGRPDAEERAAKFCSRYTERLDFLQNRPHAFGQLTVRSLLETARQFLLELSFFDPYLQIKQRENEVAAKALPKHLEYIDSLPKEVKCRELVVGILAGNVFDWGAKEIVKLMDSAEDFGFQEAMSKIPSRPWLEDDLDRWIERLSNGPHKLVVIFVDNSGADVILGIFPFVRDLIQRGSKVVIAANSYPAINDVIYSELLVIAERVAAICPIINTAISSEMLLFMETGTSSPCLDLRRLNSQLALVMQDADLVVLEGMGRSVHTNYNVELTCETMKLAVLKNSWLAKKFGGDLFSIIFQYKPGNQL